MRNALLAVGLICGLAGCGRDAPLPPSPGVALVAKATASGLLTIAEFGAKSCISCREMEGILTSVANKTAGKANVLVIDISKDYEAAKVFQIRLMPTQVFFDAQGREIGRHLGKLSEAEVMAGLGLGS
ncbi:MAG: thioredoxin family protein [Rhodocyclaceae bacterium]